MIGIFDSGSGGLSVLYAIKERLPSADVIYFGDIKNAPYGAKSREELSLLTVNALSLLKMKGATRIVSACNSVSASLAVSLFDAIDIMPNDLIEMVGPTVSAFKNTATRTLLVATPATIASGIYQNAFRMIGKEIECVALPDLARKIEFGASDNDMKKEIDSVLTPLKGSFDTLVLACTHYPLVTKLFADSVGGDVHIFDPAVRVATRVEKQFWPQEAGSGTLEFFISADSEPFRSLVARLFPQGEYPVLITEA